jgi:hypothetical protein
VIKHGLNSDQAVVRILYPTSLGLRENQYRGLEVLQIKFDDWQEQTKSVENPVDLKVVLGRKQNETTVLMPEQEVVVNMLEFLNRAN